MLNLLKLALCGNRPLAGIAVNRLLWTVRWAGVYALYTFGYSTKRNISHGLVAAVAICNPVYLVFPKLSDNFPLILLCKSSGLSGFRILF